MSSDNSYNVVFRTLVGSHVGVITRTSFKDEAAFTAFYARSMQDGSNRPLREVYAVVAKGATEEEAEALCSAPQATNAAIAAIFRKTLRFG